VRKYVSLCLAILLTAFGATCIILAALYVRPSGHGEVGRLVELIGLATSCPFVCGLVWLLSDLEEWRRRP
jgi:hypothetical protein